MKRVITMLGAVAMVMAAIGPAGAVSPAAGLVQNASLEKPALAPGSHKNYVAPANIRGWLLTAGSVQLSTEPYWDAAAGAQSLDMNGECGAGTIEQQVATTPGTSYKVRFRLAGNPDGGPSIKELLVTFGASDATFSFDASSTNHENMGWVTRSFVASADSTSTSLRFESLIEGCYGPVIDKVQLIVL